MTNRNKTKQWYRKHINDPYVKKATAEGYRSRAVYKLQEIQDKDKLIKQGLTVVDLGSAPGSWSQLAAKLVGKAGKVFAIDLLAMDPIERVTFLQGDFLDSLIEQELLTLVGERKIDLVLSDMAPNITGITSADQVQSIALVESAISFAERVLNAKGCFVAKVFQGEGFDPLLKKLRETFSKVLVRKPKASRPNSKEVYLVGKGLK